MSKRSKKKRAESAKDTSRIEQLEPESSSGETPAESKRRREQPSQGARRQRSLRRKRAFLISASVLCVLLLAAAVVAFVFLSEVNKQLQDNSTIGEDVVELLEENEPAKAGDPFYMIIMGVDKREGETQARSDTLIVARIDPQEKAATLISIPRDTRVEIPEYGMDKINAANALGGAELVIKTVKEFTGLPISSYVEIDFNGFKDIVDSLGGVTIYVESKIQDPKAGDYDPSAYTIHPGEQRLTGAQALTFVRSREFPDGDITRIANQQIFAKALLKEMMQVSNALRMPAIVSAVAENVTTNMSIGELMSLANDMKGMDDNELETVTMPGVPKYINGISYILPDEEAFAEMLDQVSQGLTSEPVEVGEIAIDPSEVTITVRNGAGRGGVAADAARRLRARGYDVGEVGNMNQFIYDETLFVYKDDGEKAQMVQESLGIGKTVSSRGMYSFSTDILLVVGKDWGLAERSQKPLMR